MAEDENSDGGSGKQAGKDEQAGGKQPLIDRRTLLKGAVLAGGALAGGGVAIGEIVSGGAGRRATLGAAARHLSHSHPHTTQSTESTQSRQQTGSARSSSAGRVPSSAKPPNILFVMVDQLRTPQWFSATAAARALMPNLARLRRDAVSFASHYTASNDCTPARSALLTGLYTHQTGCMITGGSTLNPGFPTWGTMLRDLGYETTWYGKWHLTHGDNKWSLPKDAGALERYGFAGGTYPSPDGGPGQGWRADPEIVGQFEEWIARAPSNKPWCTAVSFVNPHDIAWWYRWSERTAPEASAPHRVHGLPPNFETPREMERRHKPRLQRSLQDTADVSFGRVPYSGPLLDRAWEPFMDLYLKLLHEVDIHIGQVLHALYSRPEIASNTVVVFTSDHGEYGASHGMRGKGAAVYEEALRVPLIVKDLRSTGKLTKAPSQARTGLTSSVDVAPLLLSIATESNSWRHDDHFAQLAHRHDLLSMLRSPEAPGRPYVLHATDEIVTEFAIETYAADAPRHVTAIRTPSAKYALYSKWAPHSTRVIADGQERELYRYDGQGGLLELDNLAGRGGALEEQLAAMHDRATKEELRQNLPRRLQEAHRLGFRNYHERATEAAVKATARRRRITEEMLEGRSVEGGLHHMLRLQEGGGRNAPGVPPYEAPRRRRSRHRQHLLRTRHPTR